MATTVFFETLENIQHSTELFSEALIFFFWLLTVSIDGDELIKTRNEVFFLCDSCAIIIRHRIFQPGSLNMVSNVDALHIEDVGQL
jgi:hypothetical protein